MIVGRRLHRATAASKRDDDEDTRIQIVAAFGRAAFSCDRRRRPRLDAMLTLVCSLWSGPRCSLAAWREQAVNILQLSSLRLSLLVFKLLQSSCLICFSSSSLLYSTNYR